VDIEHLVVRVVRDRVIMVRSLIHCDVGQNPRPQGCARAATERTQARRGVSQYVILGAGLDTFAQRRPEIASRLHLFEVDQPGPRSSEVVTVFEAVWRRDTVTVAALASNA
jgi:hypothetical protein